jgi:hypothetical protein
MKYICTVAWEHSGVKSYVQDGIYDLSEEDIKTFKDLDKSKKDGAMEFFRRAPEPEKAKVPEPEKAQEKAQEKVPGLFRGLTGR